jgi:transposase
LQRFSGVKLWFEDESLFQDAPIKRKKITARGVKPIGLTRVSRKSFYVYGSFCPLNGERFYQFKERCMYQPFAEYLADFSKEFADYYNLIIVDRAPFHTTKQLIVPDNVQLVFLPPFSPELNPAERMWGELKNRVSWEISDLEQTKSRITQELDDVDSSKLIQICNYPYIRGTTNSLKKEYLKPISIEIVNKDYTKIRELLRNTPETIKGGKPSLSQDIISKVLDLKKSGKSIRQTAQQLEISKATVQKYLKQFNDGHTFE